MDIHESKFSNANRQNILVFKAFLKANFLNVFFFNQSGPTNWKLLSQQ